ncbi:MAG: hypothetical protein CMK06_08135 [Ponticaulis sp.]|nr:hypothetical protein [Ponticaulis sp.]|tara:strand:+ start:29671 stop:30096 length:426 start_codon:yes stop_codon:yes gene_type:complete
MTKIPKLIASASFAAFLTAATGCASLNVDPCSSQGIQQRLEREFNQFARNNRSDLNEIRAASTWMDGQTNFGSMKIAFAAQSLRRLVSSFERDVVPEIQGIAEQCGTVEPLKGVFIEFLRDEGVSRNVLEWVEDFDVDFTA